MAVALLGRIWAWEWGRRVRELSLEVSAQGRVNRRAGRGGGLPRAPATGSGQLADGGRDCRPRRWPQVAIWDLRVVEARERLSVSSERQGWEAEWQRLCPGCVHVMGCREGRVPSPRAQLTQRWLRRCTERTVPQQGRLVGAAARVTLCAAGAGYTSEGGLLKDADPTPLFGLPGVGL